MAKQELTENFKRLGPTDTSLLSNYDIDGTLQQWQNTLFKDFFAYDFNMADYQQINGSLATVSVPELYKRGIRTIGCIINTDVSTGRGKHWMALFGDFRSESPKFTIEFFNSSGNAPESHWKLWLHNTKNAMDDIAKSAGKQCKCVVVSRKCHQKSQTKCGVYSLYYIWSRLKGVPYTQFSNIRITDELMFEFRQHLFYDPKRPPIRQFNYEEYANNTKIKWET